ncbi:hypothetical protein TW95_gp0575 [Pandoravirus inopinatum]|uniref:Uncharacterized protein n=1 Tax=Pandoravirus inopinatum TaxID=1605721 RepID=A0A0B5J1E5_9VIRU|nr:hypothetical protein TW95_gp0575 [Pandoravirus inopinatum]AJF97309.1 hypothetical protein [Pandoravirus inopinatum]
MGKSRKKKACGQWETATALSWGTRTHQEKPHKEMGGGDFHPDFDDRPEALAAMLVAAVKVDTKPLFAPLYDSVYAAVRRSADRRAYADALRAAVAHALANSAEGNGCGGDDDDAASQSRSVRMLADILSPARCALGLGPEAFATLLTMSPSP